VEAAERARNLRGVRVRVHRPWRRRG
jgi:hypothetical protein